MSPLFNKSHPILPVDIQSLLLTLLLISLFFPFYITLIVFCLVMIILAATGLLSVKQWPKHRTAKSIILFTVYALGISLIFHNWVGVLIAIGMIILLFFGFYYARAARVDYLEEIMNVSLIASIILMFFAMMEHYGIIAEWDYTFLSKAMNKVHPSRVEATFFNPNYFAMILEFFSIFGLYQFIKAKRWLQKLTYLALTLCNLYSLALTGCRTSYLVIIVAYYIFFFMIGYKKQAILSLIVLTTLAIVAFGMGYLPRFNELTFAFSDRGEIWETACRALKDNFLFGQGPLTYMHVYSHYSTHYTQHAHNIFLDILLSYGLVGTSLLAYPFYQLLKLFKRMSAYPALRLPLALMVSLVSVIFTHGLTDVTIFWIQTAGIFLAVILIAPNLLKSAQEGEKIFL